MSDSVGSPPPVEELDEAQFQVYALHAVGAVLSLTRDLDALLASAIDLFLELTRAAAGFIVLMDEKTDALVFGAAKGFKKGVVEKTRVNIHKDIVRDIAQRRPPILLDDLKGSRLGSFFQELVEPLGGVEIGRCFPLVSSHNLVGLINISKAQHGAIFTKSDPRVIFGTVCDRVAVAIENAQLYRHLQQELVEVRESRERLASEMAQRRLYEFIVRAAPDLMSLVRADYVYEAVNEAYCRAYGKTREQIIGKTLADIWGAEAFDTAIKEHLDTCLAGKIVRYETSFEFGVLGERCLDVCYSPYHDTDGRVTHAVVVSRDITDRKRAEEERRRLSTAVESAANAIVICDTEGAIQWVNPAFTRLTGYTLEEAIGHTLSILKSGQQDAEFYKSLWETIESGRVWHGEFVNRRKDGTLYTEEQTITPVLDEDGAITDFIAIKQDVTERKRMEKELAEERRGLKRAVEARTQELHASVSQLEHANLQLQEVNRHKSKFLSSMSHELRTPLNAILGFSDVLTGQARGPLNEKQLHFVLRINQGGKHLLALINDLLDMAKIDAGAMEIEWTTFPPNECIDPVVGMMATQFQKKNLEVKVYIHPDTPALYGDLLKGKQIMLNLLSNAVKYTSKGGRIEVQAFGQSEDRVRISVTDTGVGIELEQQVEIFSEFHQADHVRDEAMGGIGLGLALTRRLVEMHGGEIGVESEPDKGSTFWFTFPVAPTKREEGIAEAHGVEGIAPIPSGHRILVVEDMEVNLEVVLEMLDGHNHEVAVARDGQQAIELAKSFGPELILMDVKMPVMDGLEATRRLRAMAKFTEIPIIALTASAGLDTIETCLAAGCTAHLAKPIESESLYAALQKHLPASAQKDHSI